MSPGSHQAVTAGPRSRFAPAKGRSGLILGSTKRRPRVTSDTIVVGTSIQPARTSRESEVGVGGRATRVGILSVLGRGIQRELSTASRARLQARNALDRPLGLNLMMGRGLT